MNRRRWVIVLAALFAFFAIGASWARVLFSDTQGHPRGDDIQYAVEQGWFQGYPDGSFRPDQSITPIQIVAVVMRAFPEGSTRADMASFLRGGQERLDRQRGPGPTGPGLLDLDYSELGGMSWDEIVAAADGGRVNWFMWGGSAVINAYVQDWVAAEAEERYNIDLNQVRITDTVNAVDTVISESEAGEYTSGSIDLIWINGENFKTMKDAGLLLCGYWDVMPSMRNVDQGAGHIAYDFGTSVDECEVPWNWAHSAVFYNSDLAPEPPADMDALLEAACANPGTFTYPAPPDFTGSVFVRHVLLNEANKLLPGGYEDLLVPYSEVDSVVYERVTDATWETLNGLEPCLWRGGATYPVNQPALEQLYSSGEVTHFLAYGPAAAGSKVEDGTFPESTRTYGLESGQIGNVDFVAIPYNSPNKAATLVVADLLLGVDGQVQKAYPDVWGQINVLNPASQLAFADVPRHPSVVDPADVVGLPELPGDWVYPLERDWQANVAER